MDGVSQCQAGEASGGFLNHAAKTCVWVACLVFTGNVWAQQTLSLAQAVEEALRAEPELAIAEARIQQAGGQRVQAGLRPNPRMTLQSEDLGPSANPGTSFSFPNSTQDYFFVGQVIETGGKRGHRLEVAKSNMASAELAREQLRRQIVARVSAAYWLAVGSLQVRELNEQNLRTYDQDVSYSSNRVKEGVAAEADLIRIRIERDRVKVALLRARREADQASIQLMKALGRSEFAPVTLSGLLDQPAVVTPPDIVRVLETRPEMRMAREAVRLAEADLQLQKAEAKPNPEAFAGYKRNAGANTAYLALQMDLPVGNRNQGNIAAAVGREHEAQAKLRATEIAVGADVEAAGRAYADQRELLQDLPETLARAEESERLARAAYREGALDLLRLLDAERSRIQVQVEYYGALKELQQSIVNLQLASGENLPGERK